MAAYCRVLAIDDHAESLNLARSKLGSDRVREGTCTSLPVPDSSADILTALDVVEHIEEDQKALVEFSRVLRPGGVLIITVPALMWLWSDWDEVLHHFRRYTRRSLKRIIPMESFEPVHINYVNVVVLPIVFLVRKVRSLRRRTRTEPNVRSEDMTPPSWVNAPLKWLFVKLACQRVVPFPAGVGLLAVLRRR
jgi:ubiquinone/menaquinone biosynthesis C-methylase UbiE